jgi:hypothetical protein
MSLVIGGSEVLSISNAIRIFYPMALVVPGLCILFIFGGSEQWASATVSITTPLYVHMTIKVTNADYLSGVKIGVRLKKGQKEWSIKPYRPAYPVK